MAGPAVVEALDVAEDRGPGFGLGWPGAPVDEVLLQARVEALEHGVVEAVAAASHRDVDPDAAAAAREDQRRELRAPVAVMDQADVRTTARDGHLERVDDELCAEVIGERPADDPPAVAVHHAGQLQPAFPRADVGDVRAPQPVDGGWVEVALDQVGRGPDARHRDGRLAAPAPDHPRQAGPAHQPLDALAPDPDVVFEAQLGVHARRPVGLARLGVDLSDPLAQRVVADRALPWRTVRPGVKARPADLQHAAHDLDRVLRPLRRDEPEDPHRVALSLAKKAAAFFRISRSSVTVRNSRRNLRSSSRSSLVSPPERPASTSSSRLQLRSDCGETPSSFARCGTDLPLLLSSTTASRRNSSRYQAGMNTILSQSAHRAQRTGVHETGGTPEVEEADADVARWIGSQSQAPGCLLGRRGG